MAEEEQVQVPDAVVQTSRRRLGCGTYVWIALGLVVVIFLLLPAYSSCPGAFRRARCCNNLKQIGLAMERYAIKYHCYPPAYTVDERGNRMHSWRALLLEFLDTGLFAEYDFSQPWNSAGNLAFAETMKKDGPYHCIAEQPETPMNTSYVMVTGPAAFGHGWKGRKPTEITDPRETTITVVEMSPSGILWTAPYDLDMAEMSYRVNDPGRAGPRSCHSRGANVLLADGSVTYICDVGQDIEKLMKAMVTINGGEDVSGFDP
jgi:prepilin-type processing-associated H-X9-DG protein